MLAKPIVHIPPNSALPSFRRIQHFLLEFSASSDLVGECQVAIFRQGMKMSLEAAKRGDRLAKKYKKDEANQLKHRGHGAWKGPTKVIHADRNQYCSERKQ